MAVSLFVQLTVKNFDAWKEMFDGAAPFMKEMGVTASTVYRKTNDPNSIMVAQQVSESSANEYLAKLYAKSVSWQAALERMGVVGVSEVRFLETVI